MAKTKRGKPAKTGKTGKTGKTDASALKTLAAVFESPGDDEVRQVVADALLEQNHPWGEFISLQLAAHAGPAKSTLVMRKRAAELVKDHVETFAGPIAQVASLLASKRCLVFENGFLAEVTLDRRLVPRPAWEAAAKAPHWATVRSVNFSVLTTPHWWIAEWSKNPAATRNLCAFHCAAIALERDAPTAGWRVVQGVGRSPYANILAAFAGGLPPAERARITFGPKIAAKHKPDLQAALATAGKR